MPVPDTPLASPLDSLLDSLRDELGPAGVLTDPADLASYVEDWTGTHRGSTPAVLRPGTTAEVAAAVRLCHEAGAALVPQGGNTGLAAGAVPDQSGDQLVLSLSRLRDVRDVDPVADTITVEAGVVLADVQRVAADAGRLFPLSLGSGGSCTVGGTIATNAGGTAVLRYGMMRELVLGLEVVLPDGRVWDGLRRVRKDNTGYDLKQLFVGSEGTLGVVTAAVLRLFPPTPRRATAWLAVPTVDAAVSVLGLLRRHAGAHLSTWELVSRQALDLVLEHLPGARDPFADPHPWYGLVELGGAEVDQALDDALETALGEAVEGGLVTDAVVAGSPTQRASLWQLREGVSEAQKHAGPGLKHDVTLPIGELAAFVDEVAPRLDVLGAGGAAGDVRPRRRRQPALQPERAARWCGRRVVHPARRGAHPDRVRRRVGPRRQHQRGARAGHAEARCGRVVQGRRGGRPDARGQAGARPCGTDEPREGAAGLGLL